jgi:hypothetical protein
VTLQEITPYPSQSPPTKISNHTVTKKKTKTKKKKKNKKWTALLGLKPIIYKEIPGSAAAAPKGLQSSK